MLGPNPRPGPTRADLGEMPSQELSALMKITPSHSGIRAVFLREVIWPVFPAKRSSSRPLMGKGNSVSERSRGALTSAKQHRPPPGFSAHVRTPSSSDAHCSLQSPQESKGCGHQITTTGHVCRRVYSPSPPSRASHHPHLIPRPGHHRTFVSTRTSVSSAFQMPVIRGLQRPEVTHSARVRLGSRPTQRPVLGLQRFLPTGLSIVKEVRSLPTK